MRTKYGIFFSIASAALFVFALLAAAGNRHGLNGTWTLVPTRSDFAGQDAVQTGSVTINDREGNIYISRSFNFDGGNESFSYSFSTDGRENSTIRNGRNFKSKAHWDERALTVRTTQDGSTSVERYVLSPDGTLILNVDRPGHKPVTLVFQRQ